MLEIYTSVVAQDLQNKSSSLETAKMMITSLESASGSQANDLRAKLKERNVSIQSYRIIPPSFKRHRVSLQYLHEP